MTSSYDILTSKTRILTRLCAAAKIWTRILRGRSCIFPLVKAFTGCARPAGSGTSTYTACTATLVTLAANRTGASTIESHPPLSPSLRQASTSFSSHELDSRHSPSTRSIRPCDNACHHEIHDSGANQHVFNWIRTASTIHRYEGTGPGVIQGAMKGHQGPYNVKYTYSRKVSLIDGVT
jgi:hypothetical protein